jgi:hypothetical protein
MNDNVRAKLLERLAQQNFAGVTPEHRTSLLQFFSDPKCALHDQTQGEAMDQAAG